jgi:isoquinoline 1-oxidoreductase beta subunit
MSIRPSPSRFPSPAARACVDLAIRTHGRIDILINNAGVFIVNDVAFVGDADVASTGTGEPGSVPTAAAIANAVFAASGRRVRRLPIAAAFARPAAIPSGD